MPGKFSWAYGRRVPIGGGAVQPFKCPVCRDAGCLLCTGQAQPDPAPRPRLVAPPDYRAGPSPAPAPLLLPPPAPEPPRPPWVPPPGEVKGAGYLLRLVDERREEAEAARSRAAQAAGLARLAAQGEEAP